MSNEISYIDRFRLRRFAGFGCQSCGHRSFDVFIRYGAPKDGSRMKVLCKCGSCNRVSALRHPLWEIARLVSVFGLVFLLMYTFLSGYLAGGTFPVRLAFLAIGLVGLDLLLVLIRRSPRSYAPSDDL